MHCALKRYRVHWNLCKMNKIAQGRRRNRHAQRTRVRLTACGAFRLRPAIPGADFLREYSTDTA